MATRTIPPLFPLVHEAELFTRKIVKGSVLQRIAKAQNWIWAKFGKVYANHGYEGHGYAQQHILSSRVTPPTSPTVTPKGMDPDLVDPPDGGFKALPLCSFIVPPNWGASRRLLVKGRSNLLKANASQGEIIVALYTLDEVPIGVYKSNRQTAAGDEDWSLELAVPQDKFYQCKVFQRFYDGATTDENNVSDGFLTYYVSARYDVGNATEIGGDAVTAEWSPTSESVLGYDESFNAAILQRILRNTMHIYATRPPELCQSWLANPYNNTSSYVEVGRYKVWLPHMVTEVTGKLLVHCTHGGAGNNVRVMLDGVAVFTSGTLSAGETEVDVTAFAIGDAAEHTITIEAKSTAASADWGTSVYGVSFWESGLTMALGSVPAVPAAFVPVDESSLEGDDAIVWQDNLQAQKSGLYYMIRNDRWLARNRLRHLIGDWRHRVYKRLILHPDTTIVEKAGDWTRGYEQLDYQLGRPKNITVRGDDAAFDDFDGYSLFPNGTVTSFTGDDGANIATAAPNPTLPAPFPGVGLYYGWPHDYEVTQPGRRLAKHYVATPASTSPLAEEVTAQWLLLTRHRRLRPFLLASDINGSGPRDEEPPGIVPLPPATKGYHNAGYLQPDYDGSNTNPIHIHGRGTIPDFEKHWGAPLAGYHSTGSLALAIVGRLEGHATTLFDSVSTQGLHYGTKTRDEGELFEIELNSVYFADTPLNQEVLDGL